MNRAKIDAGSGMLITYTGKLINVSDPQPDQICIADIAHALSNTCRFGGHTKWFYSVAEHSVRCAEIVETPANKLAALLHDASEAYLGDIPTPLKRLMPDYYKLEYRMMEVIAAKYGFNYPLPVEVEAIDLGLLQMEWDEYIACTAVEFPLNNDKAEAEFIALFNEITKGAFNEDI